MHPGAHVGSATTRPVTSQTGAIRGANCITLRHLITFITCGLRLVRVLAAYPTSSHPLYHPITPSIYYLIPHHTTTASPSPPSPPCVTRVYSAG
ncbi:hypothetical protein E2C01_079966 [Portunus trituberculatus]|uniref:Uncharacterized protein n=1 Tax=Portunus trituberculatus TaxID=210409 RepID=A0A5B7IS60_PORTR|nr:hypothetical protein [Portunus trituberculatus]